MQDHAEQHEAESDGDDRVRRGDDGLDRRQELALLKGVLVKDEPHRSHDGQHIDRPVGEHSGWPAAKLRRHDLDCERGDAVAGAAGQRQRERPQVAISGGRGQTASHHHDQRDGQWNKSTEAYVRAAGRRSPDGEKPGNADRGRADAREQDGIPSLGPRRKTARVPSHGPDDQHREDQVEDQQRLYHGQAPQAERHDLQDETNEVRQDPDQPQRLPDQIQQDRRRQRTLGLDPLGTARVGHGRYPEQQRARQGGYHSDCTQTRPRPPVPVPAGIPRPRPGQTESITGIPSPPVATDSTASSGSEVRTMSAATTARGVLAQRRPCPAAVDAVGRPPRPLPHPLPPAWPTFPPSLERR